MLDVGDVNTRLNLGRSPRQQDLEVSECRFPALRTHAAAELSGILASRLEDGFQEFFSEKRSWVWQLGPQWFCTQQSVD